MIEEIVEELRESNRIKSPRDTNEITVSELLQCREKSRFIREGRVPDVQGTDVVRQGWICSFVRDSMQRVLGDDGWSTNVKFGRSFGEYRLTGVADAWKGIRLVMIKCPMNAVKGKKLPDAHLLQAMMLLNLAGLEYCRVLYLHKEDTREMLVTEPMSDEDIVWIIEHPDSPYYARECSSCFYRKYCDVGLKEDMNKSRMKGK